MTRSHLSPMRAGPRALLFGSLAAGATLAALLAGCAGYSIKYKGKGDGYDVYRPEPYLLVSYETQGGTAGAGEHVIATAKIVWMPNYNHPYRVRSYGNLGKADFKFAFTDGWMLANIEDKSDNAELASKLLEVIRPIVIPAEKPEVSSAARILPEAREAFGFYAFVFDSTTGAVTGLKRLGH